MKCASSPYLLDWFSLAAHRCRNGGQVNEPETITTGFSLSNCAKLNVFPSTSRNVKSMADSPTAKPTFSKPPEGLLRWHPFVRASDDNRPSALESGDDDDAGVGAGAGTGAGGEPPQLAKINRKQITSIVKITNLFIFKIILVLGCHCQYPKIAMNTWAGGMQLRYWGGRRFWQGNE